MTTIIWDVETTGLLAPGAASLSQQPYIIEIAAIKIDQKNNTELGSLHLIINPMVPISETITKITGFTNALVANKKPFVAHWKEIAEFWRGCDTIVGHNVMFDKMVLFWELKRIGKENNFPWAINDICTIETVQKWLGHRMNLMDLHVKLFGEVFASAHSAMNDAHATRRCYFRMIEMGLLPHDLGTSLWPGPFAC